MTWLCIKGQGGSKTRGEEREEERGMAEEGGRSSPPHTGWWRSSELVFVVGFGWERALVGSTQTYFLVHLAPLHI